MTMTVQSMSQAVGSTAAAGKTGGAQGTAAAGVTFDAALAYQMSGANAGTSQASTETAMKLESLLQGIPLQMDEALEGLLDMLQGMLGELDQLDEKLAEDPALLEELQSWLAQASLLLSGATSQKEEAGANVVPSSTLAQHPDTVRFVVQDTVAQLTAMVRSTGKLEPGTEAALKQLVQAFHSLGHKAGSDKTPDLEFAKLVSGQPSESAAPDARGITNGGARPQHAAVASPVKHAESIRIVSGQGTENAGKSTQIEDQMLPEHGPVPAGQLALRSGTQVAVKPAAPPVPVEQFSNEMTSFIINKFEIVKQQGFSEARISLNPEHLGQVDIKLTMQNGQLVAQFMTSTKDARELIDQQMAQLRTALAAQGLQVEKIEVTQSGQPSTANPYQEGRQPGSGNQQSQQRSKEKERPSDDAVIAAGLTEEWHDWLSELQAAGAQDDEPSGTFTAKA